jgi:hypothetical protein
MENHLSQNRKWNSWRDWFFLITDGQVARMPDENGARFGSFFRRHRVRHLPHPSRRHRSSHLFDGTLKVSLCLFFFDPCRDFCCRDISSKQLLTKLSLFNRIDRQAQGWVGRWIDGKNRQIDGQTGRGIWGQKNKWIGRLINKHMDG